MHKLIFALRLESWIRESFTMLSVIALFQFNKKEREVSYSPLTPPSLREKRVLKQYMYLRALFTESQHTQGFG